MKAPSAKAIETATLALLDERGTATACPSEIARKIGGAEWRALMPAVRAVASKLQARGLVNGYQRGRPIQIEGARGPIRLRAAAVTSIDYRAHPEKYVIGRGEQGVLTVEPYKSELLPQWRFRTPAIARASSKALYEKFVAYGKAGDFVGMDMARKFIQMGWTRARRYANHPTGRKYDAKREVLPTVEDAGKASAAAIFKRVLDRVSKDATYRRLRASHAR